LVARDEDRDCYRYQTITPENPPRFALPKLREDEDRAAIY
jgi:hypothetical protein